MDIQPVNNGHVLVVPRAHYESIFEVPAELGQHSSRSRCRWRMPFANVTGCEDINIVVNSGEAAGQDEPHYHVHIIPRREGDGFDIPLPFGGSQMPDRTLLDAYAARIVSGAARSDEGELAERQGRRRRVSHARDAVARPGRRASRFIAVGGSPRCLADVRRVGNEKPTICRARKLRATPWCISQ